MKISLIFLILIVCVYSRHINKKYYCFPHGKAIPQLTQQQLPQDFWWGNKDGVNYLTYQRNQYLIQQCGACWAFATTSALNDRIKIRRQAKGPDVILSPQVLLSCGAGGRYIGEGGCNGGDALCAYQWIKINYITDETCSPYQAKDDNPNGGQFLACTASTKCGIRSENGQQLLPQKRAKIYGVQHFDYIEPKDDKDMVLAMMNEIKQRGPIVCLINSDLNDPDYKEGIYKKKDGQKGVEHYVSITGWGKQNNISYWRVRNSYGSYWGQNGNLKIQMRINKFNIQKKKHCVYAVPIDTWKHDIRNQTQPIQYIQNQVKPISISTVQSTTIAETIKSSYEIKSSKDINQTMKRFERLKSQQASQPLDWRNEKDKNGNYTNYLSWTRNQNLPYQCGSSWAIGATNSIADRINIARERKFPDILLSPQVLINCGIGTCNKGVYYVDGIYKYAQQKGLPEDSCQAYESSNPYPGCYKSQVCQNCLNQQETGSGFICGDQPSYKVWKISGYGTVSGVLYMKAQLQNGPIQCIIELNQQLKDYKGGLFYPTNKDYWQIKRFASVVGWGIENDTEFWIIRNFWGSAWGQDGFFRVQTGKNIIGIEDLCYWATVNDKPQIINPKKDLLVD